MRTGRSTSSPSQSSSPCSPAGYPGGSQRMKTSYLADSHLKRVSVHKHIYATNNVVNIWNRFELKRNPKRIKIESAGSFLM